MDPLSSSNDQFDPQDSHTCKVRLVERVSYITQSCGFDSPHDTSFLRDYLDSVPESAFDDEEERL